MSNSSLVEQIKYLKSLVENHENCSYYSLVSKDISEIKYLTKNAIDNVVYKSNETGGTLASLVMNVCFLIFLLHMCISSFYKTKQQKLLEEREYS